MADDDISWHDEPKNDDVTWHDETTPTAPKTLADRISNAWEKATPGGPLWMVREAARGIKRAVEGSEAAVAPQVGTEEEELARRTAEEQGPGGAFAAASVLGPTTPPGGARFFAVPRRIEPPPPPPPQPPPLPAAAAVSNVPRQVVRPDVGVDLLPPETPHEPPPARASLSAAGVGSTLTDLSPDTVQFLRQKMAQQPFTANTLEDRLGEMSAHQFFGEITPSLESDMGGIAGPAGPGKHEVVASVTQRAAEARARQQALFDQAFGENENVPQLTRLIEGDRDQAASPLYRQFRNTVIEPSPEVDAMMPRLRAAGALQAANKALAEEGQPRTNSFIDFEGPETGETRVPTAAAFDYAKQHLDQLISKAVENGDANSARRYTQMKNNLDAALDAHPDAGRLWQVARQAYAGPTSRLDAMRFGQRVLTGNVNADELPFLTSAYTDGQMQAMRIGMRSYLENLLNSRAQVTAEVFNKILSPNSIQKIRWAIGDQAADRLISGMQHEYEMRNAPTRILYGSPTATRSAAMKEWSGGPSEAGVDYADLAAKGLEAFHKPIRTAIKTGVNKMLSVNAEKRGIANEAKWAKIREEASRVYTLQGLERDAAARYLFGVGAAPYAKGGRVSPKKKAEKALPANHQLGMRVPKGGSRCGNCKFLSSDTTCGNAGFVKWNGGATLPAPKDEYCCDNYQKAKGYETGGVVRALRAAKGYADGGAPDDDEGAMMPETFVPRGLREWTEQAAPKDVGIIKGAYEGLRSLPQRAFEASETMRRGEGYDPGPILEAATLPMGTGAIAGLPLRAGETALGAGAIAKKAAEEAGAEAVKVPAIKAPEALKQFKNATGRDYGTAPTDIPLLGRGEISLPPHMTLEQFEKEVGTKVNDVKEHNTPERRFWYENSGNAINEATGYEPEMADRLTYGVSKTSQGTPVQDNAAYAVRAHNQLMAGEPVLSGRFPNVMGPAIEKAYREGPGAIGPKISGYQSGFRSVWTPQLNAGANDIWNMRWLGFKQGAASAPQRVQDAEGKWISKPAAADSPYTGTPTTSQHNYDRMVRSAVTDRLNAEGFDGGNWTPGQVQAVGWAKMRGVEDADDIAGALNARAARLTWESASGKTTDHMPEYHDAPFEVKQEYHDAISKALHDDNGRDLIASHMGLLTQPSENGLGVYQNAVSPGTHAKVLTGSSPGGWQKGIDPASRQLMEAAELARGTLLQQDAVAFHYPYFPTNGLSWKNANLLDVRTGKSMTLNEAKAVSDALVKETGSDFFSPIFTNNGYRFINVPEYSGVSTKQLHDVLKDKILPKINKDAHIEIGYSDGFYQPNNWAEDGPNGYLKLLKAFRPDVQRRAAELFATLGPRVSAVEEQFAQRYGWTPNRANRIWETNPAYQGAPEAQVTPGTPPQPWRPDFGQKQFRPELMSRRRGGRITAAIGRAILASKGL